MGVPMDPSDFLKAAMRGDVEALRAGLAAGSDPDTAGRNGMTALMCTAWTDDHAAAMRLLLDAGADVTARQSSSGWTALTFAAVNGRVSCLQLLFDRGVTLDEGAGDWKALMFAAQYRSHETAEMLLQHGANPDVRDDDVRTPLMRAAKNSDAKMVDLLLAGGADVAATDAEGRTALHVACGRANAHNVTALLAAGADRRARDDEGRTPLDVAREKSRKPILRALDADA